MKQNIWALWPAMVAFAFALPLYSQDNTQTVQTPDGLRFSLPSGLQLVKAPFTAAQLSPNVQLLAAYTDDNPAPLQLFVIRNPAATAKSLPLPTTATLHEFTEGYLYGARLRAPSSEPFDVTPAVFHAQLGAYEVHHKLRGPSQARVLLGQPDASPAWDPVRQGGIEPQQLRCVITQLLGKADSAEAAGLHVSAKTAAQSCGWSDERVAMYIGASKAAFAPTVTANAGISFLTRSAQIQVVLVAPAARSADVRAVAAQVIKTAQLPAAIKLEPSLLNDLDTLTPTVIGRLIGAALGPVFVFVALGGLVALLLGKVGVRPGVSVPSIAALLLALAIIGALRTPVFSIFTLIQCCSYLLTVVLAQRPLTRWVASRSTLKSA